MNTFHPEHIRAFLRFHFPQDISVVQFLGAGMFSQAFFFHTGQGEFVIRLNRDDEDFHKDRFAYAHFSSVLVPIPKILTIGQFDEQYSFAIVERCPGCTVEASEEQAIYQALPAIWQTLKTIHSIDVSNAMR